MEKVALQTNALLGTLAKDMQAWKKAHLFTF